MAEASVSGRSTNGGSTPSLVEVRPVLLPVKSTSVASPDSYWKSYVERWHQAKRHSHATAELAYALVVVFDGMWALPLRAYSLSLVGRVCWIIWRLFFINVLPLLQPVAFGLVTALWLFHRAEVPACPQPDFSVGFYSKSDVLCAVAGAWNLVWPTIIPVILIVLTNIAFLWVSFVGPAQRAASRSIWAYEDGGIPKCCGFILPVVVVMVFVDVFLLMPPLLLPYGFAPLIVGYVNVLVRGNRIEYITASKGIAACSSPVQIAVLGQPSR